MKINSSKKIITPIGKKIRIRQESEEENKSKIIIIIILLFLLFSSIVFTTASMIYPPLGDKIEKLWVNTVHRDKPTAPVIAGGSEEWAKKRIIRVIKNAHSYEEIDYYEYCITKEKSSKNCTFHRTDTKNTVVSKTGKYYIYFRGVSKQGTKGALSNREVAYIDNNNPILEKIMVEEVQATTAKVRVFAKDNESGIKDYYYKLNDSDWKETSSTIELKELLKQTKYNLEVKVEDKVGNSTIGKVAIETTEKDSSTEDTNKDKEDKDNKDEEELLPPTYQVTPSLDKWSSFKVVEIIYPAGVEQEYSLDHGKTWKKYTGPITFTKNGTIIGRSKKGKKTKDANELKIEFIDDEMPKIDLDDVPSEFYYGDSYKLPSHVTFGKSGGVAKCTVEKKEYTNTKTIGIGPHTIKCTATGNNGLEATVEKDIKVIEKQETEEAWDGWITLNLYYPEESTNRMWRLGDPNEIREGEDDGWKEYTGPITVKLTDVENVYIKYTINGNDVIIPPAGKLLVDITPEKYELKQNEKTKVTITYDEEAEVKEYKINNGQWKTYKKEIEISGNSLIEARAIKTEKIRDKDGNLLGTRKIQGNDSLYIPLEKGDSTTPTPTPTPTPTTSPSPTNSPDDDKNDSIPKPDVPSTYLKGPNIIPATEEVVEQVEVKVTTEEEASAIYIKVGNGSYKKYTQPIMVSSNEIIYAYYIRKSDGKVSATSTYYIQNIKVPKKPYVRIDATPAPYIKDQASDKIAVTISGQDYDRLEYSLDGINYQPYITPLTITTPGTIYAKGINANGETIQTLAITNIVAPDTGKDVIPPKRQDLKVEIYAEPDYENSNKIAKKTKIKITYDEKATRKTYRINGGNEIAYTGEFELDQNGLIEAFAYGDKAYGKVSKKIDFLVTGISAPNIIPSDANDVPVSSLIITIDYDKNASIKKYKLGDGAYQDYTGPFTLDDNTKVTAYNENILGDKAESTYDVTGIIYQRPPVIIDYGKYFLLKLNYPSTSKEAGREYKYKKDGKWKHYPSDGILLVKPEYQDELLNSNGLKIKIKDENGNLIDFKGDYYIIDIPFNELMEHIFMRWDTIKPAAPTINIDPTDETKEVEVSVIYEKVLKDRYYKIIYEDTTETEWIKYTGPFIMKKNGTVYAKGYTASDVESQIGSRKIENIDQELPEITLEGEFIKARNSYPVTVKVKDNMTIATIMWSKGKHDTTYFENDGEEINNYSQVIIKENGFYTFYAKDKAGNETILVKEITNIDKSKPDIVIKTIGTGPATKTKIQIDYGTSKTKEYKIGNGSWTSYKGPFDVDSYTLIKNNWVNADGSFTVYARGTNEAGNSKEVEENIYILDLDIPKAPVINIMDGGYPTLTEYGVKTTSVTKIAFDEREDITNYYSVDKGKTWKKYTSAIITGYGDIWVKSVKDSSGLEVITKKTISLPADALGTNAYDGNIETSVTTGTYYIQVNNNMQNQDVQIKYTGSSRSVYGPNSQLIINMLDDNNTVLATVPYSFKSAELLTNVFTIKSGTTKLKIDLPLVKSDAYGDSTTFLKEIDPYKAPKIISTKIYPVLTEYGIEPGYNTVLINYHLTAVKRLYSINNGATWKEYEDKKITLPLGTKILAKSIDKNGEESIQAQYTSVLPSDALGTNAYDGNIETSVTTGTYYIQVNKNMQNRDVQIKYTGSSRSSYGQNSQLIINMLDDNNTVLAKVPYSFKTTELLTNVFTIKSGTTKLKIDLPLVKDDAYGNRSSFLKEIAPYKAPKIISTKMYPQLTEYGIEPGYNTVLINYHLTAAKRLYSINNGATWKEYEDKKITLKLGAKILAKSIDKNGEESIQAQYTSVLPSDALGTNAYDGNIETSVTTGTYYIQVNKNMQNRDVQIKYTGNKSAYGSNSQLIINMLDDNNTVLAKVPYSFMSMKLLTNVFTIKSGTTKLKIDLPLVKNDAYGDSTTFLKEIAPATTTTNNSLKSEITGEKREKVVEFLHPKYTVLNNINWAIEKNIAIDYGQNNSQNEYSLDLGKTWNTYQGSIEVNKPTTILARSVVDGKVVGTSSYKVTKIDTTVPTISLDNVPSSFEVGSDYPLPSLYTINEAKSGGRAICKIGDVEYPSTKNIPIGKHQLSCTVITGAGLQQSITKEIEVLEKQQVPEDSKEQTPIEDIPKEKETPTPTTTPTEEQEESKQETELEE